MKVSIGHDEADIMKPTEDTPPENTPCDNNPQRPMSGVRQYHAYLTSILTVAKLCGPLPLAFNALQCALDKASDFIEREHALAAIPREPIGGWRCQSCQNWNLHRDPVCTQCGQVGSVVITVSYKGRNENIT